MRWCVNRWHRGSATHTRCPPHPHLEKGNVERFPANSPLQIPSYVFVIVTDDTRDQLTRRDAFGALRGDESALLLDKGVNVVVAIFAGVGGIVMRDKVDLQVVG